MLQIATFLLFSLLSASTSDRVARTDANEIRLEHLMFQSDDNLRRGPLSVPDAAKPYPMPMRVHGGIHP